MYILIRIGLNDFRSNELVSKHKNKLESHIKDKGFYWSEKVKRYIDDKTSGIYRGSGTDYIITQCDELV